MRYIDANELIKFFNGYPIYVEFNVGDIESIINEQDTADVVEVVKCKDCKHRKKNTFCLHNMRYEDDNGFCSYGERAEG